MAWTTPRDWTYGDIPTAALFNTHIRDNLNALSTHTHSGAAGDGSAALSGVDTITFADQGSTPSAPGSSKINIFSESGVLKERVGASGAATAISIAGHVHTLQERQNVARTSANSGGDTTAAAFASAIATSESSAIITQAIDPNSAKSAVICAYSIHARCDGTAGTATITWRAKSDGSQFDTGTFTVTSGGNTTYSWVTALIDSADSSHSITLTLQGSRTGISYYTPMTTGAFAELTV